MKLGVDSLSPKFPCIRKKFFYTFDDSNFRIEHLYPDTLEAIPYNIFEFIKPCVVVFTTPNADFNVLFPPRSTFRHDDHKFEWTRQQFQDW